MGERFDIQVVGMRVEKCIGTCTGKNTFDVEPCNDKKYILFCIAKTRFSDRKYTITLYQTEGWCGSGYCHASFGYMGIQEVDEFGTETHKTKNGLPIKMENTYFSFDDGLCFEKVTAEYDDDVYYEKEWADAYNNIFSYSRVGGDEYYPNGWIKVNEDLFEEYERTIKDRPVWIFSGESATGKSTLAYYLGKDKVVFETDGAPEGKLPETIWADIIVLGNKHEITIQDIASHLPEGTEIITVDFMKGYLNE